MKNAWYCFYHDARHTLYTVFIFVGLCLMSALLILVGQFIQAERQLAQENQQLLVFIPKNIPDVVRQQLMMSMNQNQFVHDVAYVSPEQGLDDFIEKNQLDGLKEVLDDNPLPAKLVVSFRPETKQDQLISITHQMERNPHIEKYILDLDGWSESSSVYELHSTIVLALVIFLVVFSLLYYRYLACSVCQLKPEFLFWESIGLTQKSQVKILRLYFRFILCITMIILIIPCYLFGVDLGLYWDIQPSQWVISGSVTFVAHLLLLQLSTARLPWGIKSWTIYR